MKNIEDKQLHINGLVEDLLFDSEQDFVVASGSLTGHHVAASTFSKTPDNYRRRELAAKDVIVATAAVLDLKSETQEKLSQAFQ